MLFLAFCTFVNFLNDEKPELHALKEGINLATPDVMAQLILRVIVQLLYMP